MKIGIIGLGHLGRSLLQGLLCAGTATDDIAAYNRTASVCDAVREKYGIDASDDPGYVAETSDVIFFVTKGAALDELAERIPLKAYEGKTVVSFMAGVRPEKLEAACPGAEIVVAMPTVSIADCTGIIAHTKAPEPVSRLLERLGYSFETTYDGAVRSAAYAASGLGFAADLLSSYIKAGRDIGFNEDECAKITDILFTTALRRGDFDTIVTEVATKGGATERGVMRMDSVGVPEAVSDAVRLAYEKWLDPQNAENTKISPMLPHRGYLFLSGHIRRQGSLSPFCLMMSLLGVPSRPKVPRI